MPLSFCSDNHGNIAFGFFNIESDMLLLENYFFFADDFCDFICKSASKTLKKDEVWQEEFKFIVYHIADPRDIGDLMGAIHGVRFTGFIGETYKLFPFPENKKDFKQNPDGYKMQSVIIELVKKFAEKKEILIKFSEGKYVHIGPYIFDMHVFHELILYVDQGGYPCWKNEIKPGYVVQMKESIQKSSNRFFKGLFTLPPI